MAGSTAGWNLGRHGSPHQGPGVCRQHLEQAQCPASRFNPSVTSAEASQGVRALSRELGPQHRTEPFQASYQQRLRAKCLCPGRPGQGQGRVQSLRFGDPEACASCSPSGCQGPSSQHRPPGRDSLKRPGLDVPQSRHRACGRIAYERLEVVRCHGSRRQSSISKEACHGSRKGVHPLSLQGQDQGERKEESPSPQEQLKRGWLSWITVNRFYQRGTAPVWAKNTWSTEQLRCPRSRRAGWRGPPLGCGRLERVGSTAQRDLRLL